LLSALTGLLRLLLTGLLVLLAALLATTLAALLVLLATLVLVVLVHGVLLGFPPDGLRQRLCAPDVPTRSYCSVRSSELSLMVAVTESLQGLHSKTVADGFAASCLTLCSVIRSQQFGHWSGRSSKA
jgi:hypothetical protein